MIITLTAPSSTCCHGNHGGHFHSTGHHHLSHHPVASNHLYPQAGLSGFIRKVPHLTSDLLNLFRPHTGPASLEMTFWWLGECHHSSWRWWCGEVVSVTSPHGDDGVVSWWVSPVLLDVIWRRGLITFVHLPSVQSQAIFSSILGFTFLCPGWLVSLDLFISIVAVFTWLLSALSISSSHYLLGPGFVFWQWGPLLAELSLAIKILKFRVFNFLLGQLLRPFTFIKVWPLQAEERRQDTGPETVRNRRRRMRERRPVTVFMWHEIFIVQIIGHSGLGQPLLLDIQLNLQLQHPDPELDTLQFHYSIWGGEVESQQIKLKFYIFQFDHY